MFGVRVGAKATADDEAFWLKQREEFLATVRGEQEWILQEAISEGSKLGLSLNFDLVNQDVLRFSAIYNDEWWNQLEQKTRTGLREALQANIASGAGQRQLVKDITPLFGKDRAKLIASTETTRMYAEGNMIAYRSDPAVEGAEWMTVGDERICDICLAYEGAGAFDKNAAHEYPPAHPRCRCWLAPVVDGKTLAKPVSAGEIIEGPETPAYITEMQTTMPQKPLEKATARRWAEKFDATHRKAPGYTRLRNAIADWTKSSDKLRKASKDILSGVSRAGTTGERTQILMDAIKATKQFDRTLYRGIEFLPKEVSMADLRGAWSVGSTVDVPLSSASFSRSVAWDYAAKTNSRLNSVVLHFQDTQGLPIGALSKYTAEAEVLIGGQFEVISARMAGKSVLNVVLRQIARFP